MVRRQAVLHRASTFFGKQSSWARACAALLAAKSCPHKLTYVLCNVATGNRPETQEEDDAKRTARAEAPSGRE